MRRRRKALLASGLTLAVGFALSFAPPLPAALREPRSLVSQRLLDRNGELLREVLSGPEGVSRWVPLEAASPWLVEATVASEDQRFWFHPGLDPLAVVRAVRLNLRSGSVRAGASTITEQLVRGLLEDDARGWRNKAREAYWALRLERAWSKRQILEAYLNRISYGNQCYGCEAAARFYFGRSAAQLSLAQATFLAVLPRAPESFAPYQEPEEVVRWQRQLLGRLEQGGWISGEQRQLAQSEPIELHNSEPEPQAGHFCDRVVRLHPHGRVVTTSLDLSLQHQVEQILAAGVHRLAHLGVNDGAALVLDVPTGEVLALSGSVSYAEPGHGQFDAALSGRQPGSTLKPFTYSLGLERDLTAASLVPDLVMPHQVGKGFIPRNYDGRFHGPVRLREALACSYNVPVVRVLADVGVPALLRRLRGLGFARLTESPEHYGLGLTLGDGVVSLLELASAYRTLARGGRVEPVRWMLSEGPDPAHQVPLPVETIDAPPLIDPRVCAVLTDILKDPRARIPAFGAHGLLELPFECAVKTGTSKDFRDNWTVGYTPRFVVAVWVGNVDDRPMHAVSGISGAGPVFREIMLELSRRSGGSPPFAEVTGVHRARVCSASGQLPGPDCPLSFSELFVEGTTPTKTCEVHRRYDFDRRSGRLADPSCPARWRQSRVLAVYPPIYRDWMLRQGMPLPPLPANRAAVAVAYPDTNAIFKLDPVLRRRFQSVRLKPLVPHSARKVDWEMDGRRFPGDPAAGFEAWWTLQPGRHQVRVRAWDSLGHPLGLSRAVPFRVQ